MKFFVAVFCLLATFEMSFAKDIKAPLVGVFLLTNTFDPEAVNTDLASNNIKDLKSSLGFTVEATFPIARFFEIGLRGGAMAARAQSTNDSNLIHYAQLSQNHLGVITRIPIVQQPLYRVQATAEVGTTKTSLEVIDTTGEAKYFNADYSGGYTRVGGSVGVGYKSFFLYVEGGTESNKVTGLTKEGSRTGDFKEFDLSGTYYSVGLVFDQKQIK